MVTIFLKGMPMLYVSTIGDYKICKVRGDKGWEYVVIHKATNTEVGYKLTRQFAEDFAKGC